MDGLRHIIECLQREQQKKGVAKAVNLTIFYDKQGNITGRSELHVVKLYGNVSPLIQGNENQVANLLKE